MNIDLLPFSAFALESSGAAARTVSGSQTLTLRLALARQFPDRAMSGSISIGQAAPQPATLRAAVVPAGGQGLTITF